MNRDRFRQIMSAIDTEFLEEAQMPLKKAAVWPKITILAACLCLIAGIALWRSHSNITPEQYGYTLSLPESAENVSYQVTKTEPAMVEASFTADSSTYVCRMIRSDYQSDISGVIGQSAGSMCWKTRDLSLQFTQNEDADSWLSWYDEAKGIQWCLTGADPVALLTTAGQMVEAMGYQMAVAPVGATDVVYHALGLDGHTVGEVTFTLNGVRWAYRMAATPELETDFRDISGCSGPYTINRDTEVGWCPARIAYTEGGAGKLVWFDVVPGLLYSLTVDSGTDEQILFEMARQLYTPAQDTAGW